MLQTLNFLAGGRQADAKADFFRYESCAANGADESVRVRADGNDLGLFLPGDYCNLPTFATRWEVIPVTATATGTFRLGVGRVGSSRSTGVVRVVDQGAEKTAAGLQFVSSVTRAAAVGVFSMAGIRALTYKSAVKRIQVSSSIAGLVSLYACNGDPTVNPANTAGAGVNKIVRDGPNSSARAIRGDAAAAVPTVGELPGAFALVVVRVAANVPTDIPLTTPLQLNINNGLVFVPQTANADVSAFFDWEDLT